jgi:Domain of unknown function (DUF4112)
VNPPPIDVEIVSPTSPEAARRLKRLRAVAWLLDRAFTVDGKRRFGIDPLIALIPGIGDWIAALLSLFILWEAARLGIPGRILLQIGLNIAIEGLVGTVPIIGDVFDFVWQANMRNLRLVERHYRPELRARPLGRIALLVILAALFILFTIGLFAFLLFRWAWSVVAQGP